MHRRMQIVRGRDSLVIHFSISTGFEAMVESANGNGNVGQRELDCCAEIEVVVAPSVHGSSREKGCSGAAGLK